MPSLKSLRNRINSVKSTRKITQAMKMVAAAKLRRAQQRAEAARPYAERMERMLGSLGAAVAGQPDAPRLLAGTGGDAVHLLVVVSGDRGLAGPFNTNIGRFARARIRELEGQGKTVKILAVGRKGATFLKREFGSRFVAELSFAGKKSVGFEDAAEVREFVEADGTRRRVRFEISPAGDEAVAEAAVAEVPTPAVAGDAGGLLASRASLLAQFGKPGGLLHQLASGLDGRPVKPGRMPQKEAARQSFEPLDDRQALDAQIDALAADLAARLEARHAALHQLALTLSFERGKPLTQELHLFEPATSRRAITEEADKLHARMKPDQPVVEIELCAAHLVPSLARQLDLFSARPLHQQILDVTQALAAQHPGVDFYQVQPAAADSLLPERRFHLLRINA